MRERGDTAVADHAGRLSTPPEADSIPRPKILCVDDLEKNLFSLERVLAPTGAEVHKATSGNEALASTLNHEFALAILDVQMPEMDGFEVAELLRQEERTRHLPIIFVSAVFSEEYHVFRGYEAGAVDFLVKPFNTTILLNKVRFFLQLDEQRQSLLQQVQIEESRNYLEAVLMSLTDAVFVISDRGEVRTVNHAAVDLSGFRRTELIGKPALDLFPGLTSLASTSAAFGGTTPGVLQFERRESRLIDRLGHEIEVLLSASPVATPSGRTTGAVLVALDLTRKLEAEKERTQLVAAIQQSRDGVALLDTEHRMTYVNRAFGELVGADPGEAVGQTLGDFEDSRSTTLVVGDRRRRLEQGEAWEGQSRIMGRDGKVYDVEQSISPIRNEDGETSSFVALVRDVSNLRALESQLAQAQKIEAIGTLARGIAHDFNNMLTPILGYTDLCLGMLPPDDGSRRFLLEVRDAAVRSTELVKQILAFSRQSEQEPKPMALQGVIYEAGNLLRGSLPSTIGIEIDVDPECGPVMADPTQVHQVIMNLGTNAYHAMERVGGKLFIQLSEVALQKSESHNGLSVEAGACARVTIRDSGCGIPEGLLPNIFDPFFTTKEKSKGSGLGLATVHRIIKGFQGAISVTSEVGKGTRFDIFLPLCQFHDGSAARQEPAEELPRGSERILLVDDEGSVADFETEGLELLGYSVTRCTDSRSALRAFEANPEAFDLVITDLTMPSVTGIELATRMCAIRSDLPVILCTGFADTVTRDATYRAGIRAVLSKPILQRELAVAVRHALGDTAPVGQS